MRQEVDPEANIIVGATFDDTLGDKVRVSIVASGMGRVGEPAMPPPVDPRLMRARPDMRQGQPAAPQPPMQPPRQEQQRFAAPPREEDLQRRLSEAIGPGDEPRRDMPGMDQPVHPRETWRAPGNVVIEEGFSHLAWPPQSGHAQAPDSAPRGPDPFVPAPPADLRRGGRRMPDVDDFPPVAQREYRAKTGYPVPPPPPPSIQPPVEEPQRRGILDRIMGRSRRDELEDVQTGHAAPDPRRVADGSQDDWWTATDSQQHDDREGSGPLPEFFNRQRK